jgi:hypothetical protein
VFNRARLPLGLHPAREVGSIAHLRNTQWNLPYPCLPHPLPVAVAVGPALWRSLKEAHDGLTCQPNLHHYIRHYPRRWVTVVTNRLPPPSLFCIANTEYEGRRR